ncbi:hypothetical protein GCM10009869_00510 [Amnibacterium kyonggiense]
MHVGAGSELLSELADECGSRLLAGLDVSAEQRPGVRVVPPRGGSVSEQNTVSVEEGA